ncbi:hypothetical protein KNT97_gp63 [Gordonia phage Rofo]|uniref:Uncharacterized protein n=3 Tax=Vividuovirus TaxID=2560251 RepID=A0A3G3MAW7_9CAUD|nr:hypothetical protein KNT97_gp63 [Gordonia phage Rofo]YP_010099309.1 hypothetical protein KNU19_gp66 [Gordonia phage Fosterous]YP_010099644.1 hypothetical protein KNU23_gp65 [Gordonia phage Tangent]AXH46640.1 hypothetical protein SEA_ROFO_63 [Gordonia phage Rofo]AYR02785.1 hypothetical protein SEA_FOSTEROUS_66 [Gordonia phage Fosterous]AYR03615.1 hypothetical protein SEA_TANGENT_65 [Gordonia phage Tangent]
MKERGKYRPRRPRVTVYDAQWRAVWPQPNLDLVEVHAWTNDPVTEVDGHLVIAARVGWRARIGDVRIQRTETL